MLKRGRRQRLGRQPILSLPLQQLPLEVHFPEDTSQLLLAELQQRLKVIERQAGSMGGREEAAGGDLHQMLHIPERLRHGSQG